MSQTVSFWKRPLTRLCAVAFAGLFIAAPTPGNVGGCSSSAGSQVVQPGNLQASPPETAEWMFFDQGLCAGFCWRLRECGNLCAALNPSHPGFPAACATNPGDANNSPAAFTQCVRGVTIMDGTPTGNTPLRTAIFGLGQCPHSCPVGMYHTAYHWDIEACTDAVSTRTCDQSGPGSIGDTFREGVSECTNICR